jgi:hypothetical protein
VVRHAFRPQGSTLLRCSVGQDGEILEPLRSNERVDAVKTKARKYVLYARAYTVDKWAIIGLIFR